MKVIRDNELFKSLQAAKNKDEVLSIYHKYLSDPRNNVPIINNLLSIEVSRFGIYFFEQELRHSSQNNSFVVRKIIGYYPEN